MTVGGKINVEIDGEGTKSLIEALRDTFSVVSEPLGLFGDYVRLYRMDVARRISERARDIARDAGLQLTAPPVKFLAPFFERASSESEPELEELWARLLIEAGKAYSGRMLSYIDVLSKMTHAEAVTLQELAGDLDQRVGHPFEHNVSGTNREHARGAALRLLFVDANNADPAKRLDDDVIMDHFDRSMERGRRFEAEQKFVCGVLLWCTTSLYVNGEPNGLYFHYAERENKPVHYGLEAKGLAAIRHEHVFESDDRRVDVCWVELTALGLDLILSVSGRKAAFGA